MADRRNTFDIHIPRMFNDLHKRQPTTSIEIRIGEEKRDFQVVDLGDLMLQIQQASWSEELKPTKDAKFYYRDADETIQVVSDQDDFIEALSQFNGLGQRPKLLIAPDVETANLLISKCERMNPSMLENLLLNETM